MLYNIISLQSYVLIYVLLYALKIRSNHTPQIVQTISTQITSSGDSGHQGGTSDQFLSHKSEVRSEKRNAQNLSLK